VERRGKGKGHVLVNSAMTGAVHRRQGHGLWVGGIAMGHGYWSMTGAVGIGTWGGGVYCGFVNIYSRLFFRNVDSLTG
jgi:hypothetical protein